MDRTACKTNIIRHITYLHKCSTQVRCKVRILDNSLKEPSNLSFNSLSKFILLRSNKNSIKFHQVEVLKSQHFKLIKFRFCLTNVLTRVVQFSKLWINDKAETKFRILQLQLYTWQTLGHPNKTHKVTQKTRIRLNFLHLKPLNCKAHHTNHLRSGWCKICQFLVKILWRPKYSPNLIMNNFLKKQSV